MPIISELCATALQSALLAACAEATRYLQQPAFLSSDVDDFRKPVIDLVYSTLQQYARDQTALRSVTARLPDELLVDTFAHLGVYDRIRAATVCHRWRAVSLGAPGRLWTTIPALTDVVAWTALLERARNSAVTLERIKIDRRTCEEVFSILTQHMNHIKSLQLERPLASDGDHTWAVCLDNLLELPAPELEHILVIHVDYQQQCVPILAAPKLRSVRLLNFTLSCLAPCAASSALRVLVVGMCSYDEFSVQDWHILSTFPALEVLGVNLGYLAHSGSAPQLSISLAPTLKRLHFELRGDVFRLLVNSLIGGIQRVPHWKMCFNWKDICPTFQEVLPLVQGSASFASVALSYSHYLSFMLNERSGEQRIFQNVQPDATWLQFLSDVERLSCSIPYERWPIHRALLDPSLTFTALHELTCDISALYPAYATHEHTLQWPYGSCPLLRTVRVRAYRYCVPVQLRSVVAFLARVTEFVPTRRLSLLEIDNVDLVSDEGTSADALSPLQQFAEKVTVRLDGEVWPECHVVWNKSWDGMLEEDIASYVS